MREGSDTDPLVIGSRFQGYEIKAVIGRGGRARPALGGSSRPPRGGRPRRPYSAGWGRSTRSHKSRKSERWWARSGRSLSRVLTLWTSGTGRAGGVSDACAYRKLLATGSVLAKQKIAQAEALAGRGVDKKVVASGLHSHDGGATWHKGHKH